ncbi:MAG TPA: EthD domain-containing protein [Actinomycetota bacterium]
MKAHIWLRKKDGMSDEDFKDYWLTTHGPIAGDGYEHLTGYTVALVTRVPEGQEKPYDGVAILEWADRDGFKADMASPVAKESTDDLASFTSAFGLLFVEEHTVK